MSEDCFKCGSKLVPGDPEEGPSTAGGSVTRTVRSYWGPSYQQKEQGSGKPVTFTPLRCPNCRVTRAVRST